MYSGKRIDSIRRKIILHKIVKYIYESEKHILLYNYISNIYNYGIIIVILWLNKNKSSIC